VKKLFKLLENFRLFFKGALDLRGQSRTMIKDEAKEEMDDFLLICFGEMLGLPIPVSYYTLELLPYMEEELTGWEDRMMKKKSIWEEKGAQMNYDI
jgi:hypothetical protein